MSVYTKTGDKGSTGLLTGQRVDKDCLRVDAYGTVDEVNATLGLARSFCEKVLVKEEIYNLQKVNMLLMSELASDSSARYITEDHIISLEKTIDTVESQLPPLKSFLISGDNKGGAALDLARTIIRKAERKIWHLSRNEHVNNELLVVLNRLSDLCFVLMRLEEQ